MDHEVVGAIVQQEHSGRGLLKETDLLVMDPTSMSVQRAQTPKSCVEVRTL